MKKLIQFFCHFLLQQTKAMRNRSAYVVEKRTCNFLMIVLGLIGIFRVSFRYIIRRAIYYAFVIVNVKARSHIIYNIMLPNAQHLLLRAIFSRNSASIMILCLMRRSGEWFIIIHSYPVRYISCITRIYGFILHNSNVNVTSVVF